MKKNKIWKNWYIYLQILTQRSGIGSTSSRWDVPGSCKPDLERSLFQHADAPSRGNDPPTCYGRPRCLRPTIIVDRHLNIRKIWISILYK